MFGVNGKRGFTLVEVMVALAISGIVLASIYSAFQSQQNSYVAQEQVSEMQQNVRVGLDMLTRDIRLAGYDRSGGSGAGFVIGEFFDGELVSTNATQLAFTADLDDDGGIDAVTQDVDGNGSIDMSDMERVAYSLNGTNLQRLAAGGTWQTLAEHVENIEFQYVLDNGTQTTAPTTAQLDNIRNVRISILVSTEIADKNFTNTEVYLPASNDPFFSSAANLTGTVWGPFTGTATANFRRRLLKITVNCRNMGL